ncbi:hypothetical protein SAMN04487895_101433 [Paenibacillus sophorae]|uniref:DUF2802 domain-containing protein n=1 Tax=Paenibacillus sophorae TaxID=1333845 RepID=A0A1H8G9K5_9BACL|nr:hypothetical protein [Paenibacillus sophorae]QWU14150.1 hypothetical protein KP014_19720 [Paenibacillus sophorae]SEN40692.1 hypothetical protein SAMN04487895_101433 [Paenibacillus sophorae]
MQPWAYIVMLGGFALAYALFLPSRARNKDSGVDKQNLKEVEAALELYMADVERENRELLELLDSIKTQSQTNQAALQEQLSELNGRLDEMQHRTSQLETRMAANENGLLQLALSGGRGTNAQQQEVQGKAIDEPPADIKAKPVSTIKLRYPQLFELHSEGKSIDAIAKKTGMQSGEIQLILQLAKQEESA